MTSTRIALALAVLTLAACNDATSTDSLFDDDAVTLDVAAAAGDDFAVMLGTMTDNETFAAGGAEVAGGAATRSLDVSRTRSCYDEDGAEVAGCKPFSSVRMIVVDASVDGSRSSSHVNRAGTMVTWSGAVHRVADDTTHRVFTDATETSRVHTNIASGHDTTTFTDATATRMVAEAVLDSVRDLTFDLPRSSNPYPVSGSIVRHSAANVEISKDTKSVSKAVSHRIEVVFPADAQGNVTLDIDARTCQLNLVTRAVTNCQ
jgi:hypothetical protein